MQREGKTMRQWRVGSFSMALALILFGVATLVFRKEPGYVPQLILNWWPVVVILLGLEVLLAGYFCRDEAPRIKYDFLAVIIVLAIGIASLGLYALNASGFAARLTQALGAKSFTVELPEKRLAVPEGVHKIVLQGPGGGWQNLQIRSGSPDDQLVFFGQAMVTAPSEAEAKELALNAGLHTRQVGDSFFLELRDVPLTQGFASPAQILGNTLIIPANLEVEVGSDRNGAELQLVLDHLETAWSVTNSGPIRVTLNRGLNAQIEAHSRATDMFQGNINWEIQGGDLQAAEKTASTPSYNRESSVPPSSSADAVILARATVGQGGPLLRLASHDIITINVQ
ncbi:hypothetical protein MOTE_17730 [Moorella thermoacetica]|uniref:DUF5668 domain-containing protein n=1 Tax=Neomoorella thermoacetica TaxID=1525 RepID=A0A1J5NHS0_NEOTH|nr:hypothetical protein MOTE_17730 [Moorella thermoacetica]